MIRELGDRRRGKGGIKQSLLSIHCNRTGTTLCFPWGESDLLGRIRKPDRLGVQHSLSRENKRNKKGCQSSMATLGNLWAAGCRQGGERGGEGFFTGTVVQTRSIGEGGEKGRANFPGQVARNKEGWGGVG